MSRKDLIARKAAKEKQKTEKMQELQDLKNEIIFIESRINTLIENIGIREAEINKLKDQFYNIANTRLFDQTQIKLLLEQAPLEQILSSFENNENIRDLVSSQAIFEILEEIMPLETLSGLFFQIGLTPPNFQIPSDIIYKFSNENLKHPFEGLYSKFSRLITTFVINASASIIESLLSLSSNTIDLLASAVFRPEINGENPINLTKIIENSNIEVFNVIGEILNTQNVQEQQDNQSSYTALEQELLKKESEKVVDFFGRITENTLGYPSPFGEWYLSSDKKQFIFGKQPTNVDIQQIKKFTNTNFAKMLEDFMSDGLISETALKDSLGRIESGEDREISPKSLTTKENVSITFNEATREIVSLMNRVISILPPSESIPLLSKEGTDFGKKVAKKLAETAAPKMISKYSPDFIVDVLGELGQASGATQMLKFAKDYENNNLYPEVGFDAICDTYGEKDQFLEDLLSDSISANLASEILEKTNEKRIEQFDYMINAFSGFSSGEIPEKPQDAKQFYIEIVEKMVDIEKATGSIEEKEILKYLSESNPSVQTTPEENALLNNEPANQENEQAIGSTEQQTGRTPIKTLSLEEKAENFKKAMISENPTFNAILDLTADSMIRPIKDSFSRDMGMYINSITSKEKVEKPVSSMQKLSNIPTPGGLLEDKNSSVIDMKYKSMIDANMVPVLYLKKGKLRIGNQEVQEDLKEQVEQKKKLVQKLSTPSKRDFEKDFKDNPSVLESLKTSIQLYEKTIIQNTERFDEGEEKNSIQQSNNVQDDRFRKEQNFPFRLKSVEKPVWKELVDKKIPDTLWNRDVVETANAAVKEARDWYDRTEEDLNSSDPIKSNLAKVQMQAFNLPGAHPYRDMDYQHVYPLPEDFHKNSRYNVKSVYDGWQFQIACLNYTKLVTTDLSYSGQSGIPRDINSLIEKKYGNPYIDNDKLQNVKYNTLGEDLQFLRRYSKKSNSWIMEEANFRCKLTDLVWKLTYRTSSGALPTQENAIEAAEQLGREIGLDQSQIRELENRIEELGNTEEVVTQFIWDVYKILPFSLKMRSGRPDPLQKIKQTYSQYSQKIESSYKIIIDSVNREIKELEKDIVKDTADIIGENAVVEKMVVPSLVLPFQKKIGDATIKSSLPIVGVPTAYLEVPEGYYVSNGFIESSYQVQFISDENSSVNSSKGMMENIDVVGNKFIKNSIQGLNSFSVSIEPDINTTSISINSKHDYYNNNPMLQNPLLFGIESISDLNVESIPSVDYSCMLQDILQHQNNIAGAIDSLSKNSNFSEQIKRTIPVWKMEIKEKILPTEIQETFTLYTGGNCFNFNGNFIPFYHNTEIQKTNIYGKPRFRTLLDIIENNNLLLQRNDGLDNQYFKNVIRNVVEKVIKKNVGTFTDMFLQNRLLQDYYLENLEKDDFYKEEEQTAPKLVEFLKLDRVQTDLEKKNNIDPNILDFEETRKTFKMLYLQEKNDILTPEQKRSEKSSQNKATKASSKSLLFSMIRLCIVEHIVKSIFIYDEIEYELKILESEFIIKDIAKFVLTEAKRYNLHKHYHMQAEKNYDFLLSNKKITETDEDIRKYQLWEKNNSFGLTEPSPKMQKIVSYEMSKILKKFKKLMQCGEYETDNILKISKILLNQIPVVNIPENKQASSLGFEDFSYLESTADFKITEMPFSGKEMRDIRPGDFYFEKYIKIPKINPNIKFTEEGKRIYQKNLIQQVSLKNIVSFKEFDDFMTSLKKNIIGEVEIFGCGKENSLFLSPIKAGLRLSLCTQRIEAPYWNRENVKLYSSFYINAVTKKENYEPVMTERAYIVLSSDSENNEPGRRTILNNIILTREEMPIPSAVDNETTSFDIEQKYLQKIINNIIQKTETKNIFDYCLYNEEIMSALIVNSNMTHGDQDGRFLFESTKMMISKLYMTNIDPGDATKITQNLENMFAEQKTREENTGNPLGPFGEAAKFLIRTPIQILKGLATTTDPNVGISDIIVKGAAMAGSLTGQRIDIPYKLASLSLLPAPIFNGVTPPIPPLTAYNLAMPAGIAFLALEDLLRDLPYYQNNKDSRNQQNSSKEIADTRNPFFCELLPEESE